MARYLFLFISLLAFSAAAQTPVDRTPFPPGPYTQMCTNIHWVQPGVLEATCRYELLSLGRGAYQENVTRTLDVRNCQAPIEFDMNAGLTCGQAPTPQYMRY